MTRAHGSRSLRVMGSCYSVLCEQQRPGVVCFTAVLCVVTQHFFSSFFSSSSSFSSSSRCTKFSFSLLNIVFRLCWIQSWLLLIYFRDGPNRCSHSTKVWHKINPICDTPLSRSVRRSFASSEKSRRHNRSSSLSRPSFK